MVVDAFAPVLALSIAPDDGITGKEVLVANGRNLEHITVNNNVEYNVYENYCYCRFRSEVFNERASDIYGIIPNRGPDDNIIVYGEKSIGFIEVDAEDDVVPNSRVVHFNEWIQTATLLKDGSLAILFASNTVALYTIEFPYIITVSLIERQRIRSSHKACLLYSLLHGEIWEDMKAVVGTVFGDILIWQPAKGPDVLQRFVGHTGMIFGLLVRGNRLFSISDDRSLRLWCFEGGHEQLDEAYGHSARPSALCDAPQGIIITAGLDGDICLWSTDNDSLSLVRRISIGKGSIRAVLYVPNKIVVGLESGGPFLIKVGRNPRAVLSRTRLVPDKPIRSFVNLQLTDSIMSYPSVLLDSDGVLSILRGDRTERILVCESARHDTLTVSHWSARAAFASLNAVYVVSSEEQRIAPLHLDRTQSSDSLISDGTLTDSSESDSQQDLTPENPLIRVISQKLTERITSVLWTKFHLLVATESGNVVFYEFGDDFAFVQKGNVQLSSKDVPSAASSDFSVIFIGTRKGTLYFINDNKIVDKKLRCHGRQAITSIVRYRGRLLTIGRDGKLATWRHMHDDTWILMQKTRPSRYIEMEWPCKFIEYRYELLIAGFHGTNLVVVSYDTGICLCSLDCGGGHRAWQLSLQRASPSLVSSDMKARLDFVSKGDLIHMELNLANVDELMPSVHTSKMTAICAISRLNDDTMLVTAGFDTNLVLYEFITYGGKNTILPHLTCYAHTSSVYALSQLEDYVLSVGGKSEIFLWKCGEEDIISAPSFSLRLEGDARLVSAKLLCTKPYVAFVVAASDCRLELYRLKEDLSDVEQCISLTSDQATSDMMTKVTACRFGDTYTVYATSTSGNLAIWRDIQKPTECKMLHVEKAGLSALNVLQRNESTLIAIGSESGRISVFCIAGDEDEVSSYVDWHGATCTDVLIHVSKEEDVLQIISIALDSRIALFSYSMKSHKLEFSKALSLNVADPSSMCMVRINGAYSINNTQFKYSITVVGSSIQIVPLWELVSGIPHSNILDWMREDSE